MNYDVKWLVNRIEKHSLNSQMLGEIQTTYIIYLTYN